MSITFDADNNTITEDGTTITLKNLALTLPSGNTLQRPSSPNAGMIRYNNQTNQIEGYDGIRWVIIQQPGITN
jgi:hypothetical protein